MEARLNTKPSISFSDARMDTNATLIKSVYPMFAKDNLQVSVHVRVHLQFTDDGQFS